MIRRLGFWIVTNVAIIATISIILNLLGVRGYVTQQGINYSSLMVFCLVWGMAGSLISLMMSRMAAKWMTGAKVIDPQSPGRHGWVLETVHDIARKAQLPAMPQVAIYPSAEVNAFATGPCKSRSLVALSEGLLESMSKTEIEGVIGHEVAHIKNGDMVTMTLIQGAVNAFGMFIARILSFVISQNVEEEKQYFVQMILNIVFDIIFTLLGSIVVAYFSRIREFRADAGCATILGTKSPMISSLKALERLHEYVEPGRTAVSALKIGSPKKSGFLSLFASHPPLEKRINALETARVGAIN
jgi:heat shock protein HtpX